MRDKKNNQDLEGEKGEKMEEEEKEEVEGEDEGHKNLDTVGGGKLSLVLHRSVNTGKDRPLAVYAVS